MAKLGIVYGEGLSSKLTKIFTGSKAYHVIWLAGGFIYDMHLLRRRRPASYYDNKMVLYFDFPEVTQEYLERQLTESEDTYSMLDYLLFAIRPIYHLFGFSTRNAKGLICSEMCNLDLINCGYKTPFKVNEEPPSPAMLEEWAKSVKASC